MSSRGVKNQNAATRRSIRQHVNEQQQHADKGAAYLGHGKQFNDHPPTGAQMPQNPYSKDGSAAGNDPNLEAEYGSVDKGNSR